MTLGDGHDRWRSGALEFQSGDFVAGFLIYQNDPESEGLGWNRERTRANGKNHKRSIRRNGIWPNKKKKHPYGIWNNGQTYASPLFVGFKSGNRIERFGYSHKYVQQFFQNRLIHQGFFGVIPVGYQHIYLDYDNMYEGPWHYSGWYNPYSIWGR